jgi:hypothetical protein
MRGRYTIASVEALLAGEKPPYQPSPSQSMRRSKRRVSLEDVPPLKKLGYGPKLKLKY